MFLNSGTHSEKCVLLQFGCFMDSIQRTYTYLASLGQLLHVDFAMIKKYGKYETQGAMVGRAKKIVLQETSCEKQGHIVK